MINRHLKSFFKKFSTQGGHNDSFIDAIDKDVIECFAVNQRLVWDLEKTFDLAVVKELVSGLEGVDINNFRIDILDDLLLIQNDTIAIKFYSNGVMVPEIIGTRSDWFTGLSAEFINLKPTLNIDFNITDNHISTKNGLICPNSIVEIYEFIVADELEKAIRLTLKECI